MVTPSFSQSTRALRWTTSILPLLPHPDLHDDVWQRTEQVQCFLPRARISAFNVGAAHVVNDKARFWRLLYHVDGTT